MPREAVHRVAEGIVSHARLGPVPRAFRYRIWMLLVDLDTLDELATTSRWLSVDRPNLLQFRSRDWLPDVPGASLRARIESALRAEGLPPPTGPIRLLSQPVSWGAAFNPVRFVLCLDRTGARIETVLAEINNTPWDERFTYVLRAVPASSRVEFDFDKRFHVSPFNAMNQRYRWEFELTATRIHVRMAVYEQDRPLFRAGLHLRTAATTPERIRRGAFRFAAQPLVHLARIYAQAARLSLRGAAFHTHPRHALPTPENP